MAATVTTIRLGGQDRPLFYGTNAVIQAETRMGKGVRDALLGQAIGDLVTLLHAGLRVGQDSKLTTDQVAQWLDDAKRGETVVFALWDQVTDALVASGIIPAPRRTETPAEADPT